MDIVKGTITYTELDEILQKEIKKSFVYKARLDMECIKIIHQELKDKGNDFKIYEIFEEISNINTEVIAIVVIQAIKRCTDISDSEIMKVMEFHNAIDLINKLIKVCMPPNKSCKEESEFEDEEDDLADWDFDYMTYLWYSVLKRSDDFYNITPKYYFNQVELHKKFNGIKENVEQIEYI